MRHQTKKVWLVPALALACLAVCVVAWHGVARRGTDALSAAQPYGSAYGELRDEAALAETHDGAFAEEDDGVLDACSEVLERYAQTSGCEPAFAGFIDLFGNVWACLVTGEGWTEIAFVRKGADGKPQTSVVRLDGSAFAPWAGEAP